MNKITILGFLIVIEQSGDKPSENVPARKIPTLDDLFASATRSRDDEAEESWKEKYGQIFT